MTNYEWLLAMSGEERQAWFDAPHADCMQVDSGANISSDTRTLIISDVNAWIESNVGFSIWAPDLQKQIIGWLDRQAAITALEFSSRIASQRERHECEIAELQAQVDDLAKECANLQGEVYMLNAECDSLTDDWKACNCELERANAINERQDIEYAKLSSIARKQSKTLDEIFDLITDCLDEGLA